MEAFINPKSMMTPAVAAGLVSMIAGALFKTFGITVPVGSIVMSFLVCMVLFHSKEFKSENMRWYSKTVFYIINSLPIFALATGSTAVIADERDSPIKLTQERSFFIIGWLQKKYQRHRLKSLYR